MHSTGLCTSPNKRGGTHIVFLNWGITKGSLFYGLYFISTNYKHYNNAIDGTTLSQRLEPNCASNPSWGLCTKTSKIDGNRLEKSMGLGGGEIRTLDLPIHDALDHRTHVC